jgi:hypothetical protein
MTVLALIGAGALWLMYGWLLSAIVASYISERKGYGTRLGLASGLLIYVLAIPVWLVVPAKPYSRWKALGPFGRRKVGRDTPAGTG